MVVKCPITCFQIKNVRQGVDDQLEIFQPFYHSRIPSCLPLTCSLITLIFPLATASATLFALAARGSIFVQSVSLAFFPVALVHIICVKSSGGMGTTPPDMMLSYAAISPS